MRVWGGPRGSKGGAGGYGDPGEEGHLRQVWGAMGSQERYGGLWGLSAGVLEGVVPGEVRGAMDLGGVGGL